MKVPQICMNVCFCISVRNERKNETFHSDSVAEEGCDCEMMFPGGEKQWSRMFACTAMASRLVSHEKQK